MSNFSGMPPSKVKKINPLEKAIKKNPKYDHVQSTLDTGSSLTKYLKKIEDIKTNYRYQQDEIFKRMKITTFVQLLLQVAEIDTVEKDVDIDDFDSASNRNVDTLRTMSDRNLSPVPSLALTDTDYGGPQTNRVSTLQGVIRGIGELDMHQREKQARKFAHAERNLTRIQQDLDLPYLLLDIRDRDEYDQCHIITALNYPTAMLSRSMNNESPELLVYKNQPGKIIVVYDDDEKIGNRAATTLVQRGYDNLFLLSGGLKYASKKFPEGLIAGQLPGWYALPTPKTANGTMRDSATMHSNRSTMSTISNMSSASKKTFDRDDIEKLNHYLDENLMPDPMSRLSRNTTKSSRVSNAASTTSTKTLTSIHEKPWKPA